MVLTLKTIVFALFLLQGQPTHFICSYYGEIIKPQITIAEPNSEANALIKEILGVVGLHSNFEVRPANVPNAAAVILKNKRYILYNRRFMSSIVAATGTDWAGISILAHEIGHHLNGHTLTNSGSQPRLELEADEFSGFVLRKMGASLKDSQAAMEIAANLKASHTHPARRDRLIAIADGWNNANNQMHGQRTAAEAAEKNIDKPTIIKTPSTEEPLLAEKYIAFDLQFNSDPNRQYYITIRGNLVTIDNNQLYIIGRLAESNRKGYKLMLYDKNYNYLYIGGNGTIVNGGAKPIGKISKH